MSGDRDDELLPYAGRWVARLRGRIVAQGGTPAQVRRLARSRYKEIPEIIFVPALESLALPPILDDVRRALPDGVTVYLVGGALRDALLGRPVRDLDFALAGQAIAAARRVADTLRADFYPLDLQRDTGRVIVHQSDGSRLLMDFASLRGPDIDADLLGRDFTVNAIAMDLRSGALYDPLGGGRDLKDKLLRACSPSAFADDPLRILRGVRLAADFGFRLLSETRQAMKMAVVLLGDVSPERLRDELFRIFEGPRPAACLRALDLLGALDPILPELQALKGVTQPPPHVYNVWEHTLAAVDALDGLLTVLAPAWEAEQAADLFDGLLSLRLGRYRQALAEHFALSLNIHRSLRALLFFAALYHDIAKPVTLRADEDGLLRFWGHDQEGALLAEQRARALALSNEEARRIATIVRHHMRVLYHINRLWREKQPPSRRAVYRFFRDTGPAGVDVCLLVLADLRATYAQTLPQDAWAAALDVVRLLLENWFERRSENVSPPPLVNGDDLMEALALAPGPRLGQLLEAIREAQAVGELTTREEALAFARRWKP
ncbi:MAG: HD domain-containing protein [Anaerolineales bacterium]